jgi:hypothetical protein
MYLQNKYTRCYYNIVERAKARDLTGYVENHHIIPKSLGGSNNNDNLVRLTAREHFVCHWLLTKMLPDGKDRWRMMYAFYSFIRMNKNHSRTKITGIKYEILKRNISQAKSKMNLGNQYNKGRKRSKEAIEKGKKSRAGYKQSESAKMKQSITMKEKYQTQNHPHNGKTYEEIYGVDEAAKRKEKLKGLRGPRKNPPGPQKLITCPHCNKTGGVSNMKRYHFERCLFQ